jgi:ABC-type transporter Mla subunit MlaD/multisubunit Na+/H+ antiporter MnhG subunit
MRSTILLGLCFLANTSANAANNWQALFDDRLTLVIFFINLLLTAFFLIRFDRFAVSHGPEILTTMGIFGCFLGIALALLNFETRNVSASVPALLDGVKTAFWASVSGVAGALVIRLRHKLQKGPLKQAAGNPQSSSLDDLVAATQALQRSISGNDEGTLLSQLKLLRQEQRDDLSKLDKSFNDFAAKMAEDGSKALIDALKTVIADFNAQINEQFGENFKELNRAVGALVVWQQQYKEELGHLQVVQKQGATDFKSAAHDLHAVAIQATSFGESALRLEKLLLGLFKQYDQIEQTSGSLAQVLSQMKDVTPQFTKKIDDLVDSLNTGVGKVQSNMGEVVRNFGTFHQSSAAEMKSLLSDTLRKSQTELSGQLKDSLDVIRKGVVTLDKGLHDELTHSLETLGRQLASLSEKFVADYGPLTDKLRDVVRLAASKG